MSMNRAYSLITLKAVDEEKRILTGIASTPSTDRMGDIVEPKGAEFKLPLPFLWQHDSRQPIGHVTKAKVTSKGIEVEIQIAKIEEEGKLKDRVDEAWQSMKSGLVRGLSIGFSSIEAARIEGTYGMRFLKWLWLELSGVTIAANGEATITSIKSIDKQVLAASGHKALPIVRLTKPGASGGITKATPSPKPQEGKTMNLQEQIAQFTATRAEKAAAMDAIVAKSVETGETFDEAQTEEYDNLKAEVSTIDKHLARLRDHERTVVAKAAPVITNTEPSAHSASAARTSDGVIAVAKKLPPGVAFARFAGVMAAAKGSISDALHLAKEIFPEEKNLHTVISNHSRINKTASDIGTTVDADYAAPLVQYNQMASEFIEYLRPQTIVGRIPNLRRVPFNIRIPRQTNGGAAFWTGEAAPKGVTQTALDNVTLKYKKLATIAVISDELARFSQPSAELIIRDTLAGAIIQQMDLDFVNPANAGTTDVKPASITNSVSGIASSGNTEANVREDIQAVFAPFIAANLTPANGVWIMSATTALAVSLMVNNLGQPSFPGVSMSGGTLWGMPVVVSEAVGNIVILANASDILLADDGQVTIDTSREASLQMDTTPTNPPVAATVFISLWQMNLLGIRAERYVDWTKARAASVQYLSGVEWGQPTS